MCAVLVLSVPDLEGFNGSAAEMDQVLAFSLLMVDKIVNHSFVVVFLGSSR